MTVYLSGITRKLLGDNRTKSLLENYRPSIMQSFYAEKDKAMTNVSDDIMIDSGAFSMLRDKKKSNIDIYKYADSYADFIRRNKIRLYIELDLDAIIGYDNVLKIRKDLRDKTGINPIPVWHKRLGLDEFKRMCNDYQYVAIGGIVTKEIRPSEVYHLKSMIQIAHDYGAKIHGLGFTKTSVMPLYKFDSVDSTNWIYGKKWSNTSIFTGKTIKFFHRKDFAKKNMRIKDLIDIEAHDLYEWIKYQKYAKEYL